MELVAYRSSGFLGLTHVTVTPLGIEGVYSLLQVGVEGAIEYRSNCDVRQNKGAIKWDEL